ncbi:response regulator [bacterium]|nr:response regulator [bacterium]
MAGTDKPTIIIVENNQRFRPILDSSGRLDDYTVINVERLEDAIEHGENASTVIVDLLLDDTDGLLVIEELREHFRGLHIIALLQSEMTVPSLDFNTIASLASQAGANAVFSTPFNLNEMLETITRFADSGLRASA